MIDNEQMRTGQFRWCRLATKRLAMGFTTLALLAGLSGCEAHSWMDPSVVGRWQRTPVMLPILEQLDVIDEPDSSPPGLSQVRDEDLVNTVSEYVIGPTDLMTVTVFELIVPGVESVQTRRVDRLGMVRLPVIGPIKAEGYTPSQLEQYIAQTLADKGVLKDAVVSVIMQEERQNTFSVIGESNYASTAIGTYTITGKDFRLLDAMSLARGVPGQIKKLYIIRQAPLPSEVYQTPALGPDRTTGQTAPESDRPPTNPADLIDDLMQGIEPAPGQSPSAAPGVASGLEPGVGQAPPASLEAGLDAGPPSMRWVNVDGQWKQVPADRVSDAADATSTPLIAQRIIEVPYDKLLEGDTRYNVVIRAGDVIRVPPPVLGNIYIGGAISRPGTYQLPGDRDLTLKQLVFAAGNLSPTAIPERVDLTRRIGKNEEAIVRLNLREIFQGTQPDLFLKPNDTINIGTNFLATPLAVFRNGFRTSYGFGFVLDRNFSEDVFGPLQN